MNKRFTSSYLAGGLTKVLTWASGGAASKQTVFQGFWHGRPLSPVLIACLRSFIKRGHAFHLYAYEELNVPDGVTLKSASDVLPAEDIFLFRNPETDEPDICPFSDLFRFKLLLTSGGWWSDVDCICLSENIPQFRRAWARENPEWNPGAVGTSQIAFQKSDPIVRELFDRCLALSRAKLARREVTGPHLMSATIRDLGMPLDMGGTPDLFYPVRWIEMFKLWLPEFHEEVAAKAKKAYFMPIYQSFPLYIGLNRVKLPPKGSFLDDICRQFAPEFTGADRHTVDEIFAGTKSFFERKSDWAIGELVAVSGLDVLERFGLKQ